MADDWGDDGGDLPDAAGGDEQEWRSRQRRFHTLGYRDGVSAGKESSAQRGFNAGFCESVGPGYEWGLVRGLTSAFAALSPESRGILSPDEAVRDKLVSLTGTVSSVSSKDAVQSFYRHLLQQQGDEKQIEELRVDIWPIASEVRAQAAAASITFNSKASHDGGVTIQTTS